MKNHSDEIGKRFLYILGDPGPLCGSRCMEGETVACSLMTRFELGPWKGATALKLHLKPKLLSVVPSYNWDFLVPLYNCTTVVKLKLAITLATDQLKTYNLHF